MTKIFLPDKICICCGGLFNRSESPSGRLENLDDFRNRKFCSHKCYTTHNVGENHVLFKSGGSVREDGYVRVARAGKRIYLHREIAAIKLGRPLTSKEHVHHEDEEKGHNVPDNLKVCSNSEHRKIHSTTASRDKKGRFI